MSSAVVKWVSEINVAVVVFVALVLAAASSGAVFKPGTWYDSLRKPGWTPPDWAFPVVWSVLYLAMAVAGWLVWREAGMSLALTLWGTQLVLNAAWSWLFFGLRRMDLAFGDVVALWMAVAGFIVAAWPVSIWAALLFVPYLIWVTVAATLNWTVWQMNRGTQSA